MTPQLTDLLDFLRFPSVSTRPEHTRDLADCAEWLKKKFTAIGLDAEILATGGHPAVVARSPRDPAKRTVLIYGHYDVQPVEPLEEWSSPPFEPVITNDRVIARGATDNKGQILAHLLGVGEALKSGPLPVNVIFLVEGEEEIGSPNLAPLLRKHLDRFACDVIVISDTGMVAHGWPTLAYSLRGIAALEFKVFGPLHDLHSGVFGGAVMNPLAAAARLVASLHDSRGRVAIEGFYDDVRPMFDWEREAAAALPMTDLVLRDLTGVKELFGEPGYSGVERIGARPTAEVNGFGGGYQGVGTKTVLPKEATVKLTFRLVPHQKPDAILRLAETHLRRNCPPGVELEIERGHGGLPYYIDPNAPDGLAARRAMKSVFGRETALVREGGSIPIVADFKEILGVDTLLAGLASPDCRAHSPNENFPIENFTHGIALSQALLRELARPGVTPQPPTTVTRER